MSPEHLQEIRDTKFVRPDNLSDAMFHLGLAQGHRSVLLEYVAVLEKALAKEKGGWDAFYRLRKSVAEARYPGMTNEVKGKS